MYIQTRLPFHCDVQHDPGRRTDIFVDKRSSSRPVQSWAVDRTHGTPVQESGRNVVRRFLLMSYRTQYHSRFSLSWAIVILDNNEFCFSNGISVEMAELEVRYWIMTPKDRWGVLLNKFRYYHSFWSSPKNLIAPLEIGQKYPTKCFLLNRVINSFHMPSLLKYWNKMSE